MSEKIETKQGPHWSSEAHSLVMFASVLQIVHYPRLHLNYCSFRRQDSQYHYWLLKSHPTANYCSWSQGKTPVSKTLVLRTTESRCIWCIGSSPHDAVHVYQIMNNFIPMSTLCEYISIFFSDTEPFLSETVQGVYMGYCQFSIENCVLGLKPSHSVLYSIGSFFSSSWRKWKGHAVLAQQPTGLVCCVPTTQPLHSWDVCRFRISHPGGQGKPGCVEKAPFSLEKTQSLADLFGLAC